MSSEANNGPEHAGRKITYFLGLRSEPRTHAVLGHIRELKRSKDYKDHAAFFEVVLYDSINKLGTGVAKLVKKASNIHLVFVCDCATVSYINLSAPSHDELGWKVELGSKTLPHIQSNGTNSCDRQLGAAKFMIGIFVKNIDEQLAKDQLPWGPHPLSLDERRAARRGKSIGNDTNLSATPGYTGRRHTSKHNYGEHYDSTGCLIGLM